MVATRFTWPYGGRQVLLTASFTGWTNHLVMTPLPNSTTLFQVICNLPPGHHQYKFLVDGVWRVDEQQQYVTDQSGAVNNIILVEEPVMMSQNLQSVALSSRSSMEVDNGGIVQHSGLFLGAIHENLAMRISEGEIDLSRRQFSMLLSRYSVYDLLPESGKVSVFDATVAVKQAFHVMYEQGLAVAPIWDEKRGQFFGILSASDFILILSELHKNGQVLTNEELETHSIFAWKQGKYQLNRGLDKQLGTKRLLIQAGPNESLKDVALKILRNKVSTVPIIHQENESSFPLLLDLACLAGILKYVCRYFRHSPGSLPLLQQPIGRLPLGTWAPEITGAARSQLTMLHSDALLSSALMLFTEAKVSSIPIVDDRGSLLDVYSRSDVTSLAKSSAYANIQLDQTSMHQVLQLRYEANGANYCHRRLQTCLRSESLHEVVERLSDPVVRRLIVIEPGSKRVEGIISLSDIFNLLIG